MRRNNLYLCLCRIPTLNINDLILFIKAIPILIMANATLQISSHPNEAVSTDNSKYWLP
ncbi:hypothetical protein [Escherichia phage IMM-001]|nr:hypothetical protein [Escherichia phage IMM-001]